jgi:glycerol-3-phosphate acyltransferase PlsY
MARDLISASLPIWPPLAQLSWQGSPAARLDTAAGIAAIAAVLGHIYPVWLRFKGGKGVATAFGVLLQLVPLGSLIGLAIFVLTFAISRYVSLASILGALAVPSAALLLASHVSGMSLLHRPWILTAILVLPAIVIAKHHANIRRLLNGAEYRFGRPKAAS